MAFRWVTLCMREADYVYLDSNKTFNSVSHSVLLARQVRYGLDRQTTRWMGISWTAKLEGLCGAVQSPANSELLVAFLRDQSWGSILSIFTNNDELPMNQQCALTVKVARCIRGCISKSDPWTFMQHLWECIWSSVSALGFTVQEISWCTGMSSAEIPKVVLGTEHKK